MTILSEALKEKLHELCIISFFPFIHYWLGFKYAQTKILTPFYWCQSITPKIYFLLHLFVPISCPPSPPTSSHFLHRSRWFPEPLPPKVKCHAATCARRLDQLTPKQTVSPGHHHSVETITGVALYQTFTLPSLSQSTLHVSGMLLMICFMFHDCEQELAKTERSSCG